MKTKKRPQKGSLDYNTKIKILIPTFKVKTHDHYDKKGNRSEFKYVKYNTKKKHILGV